MKYTCNEYYNGKRAADPYDIFNSIARKRARQHRRAHLAYAHARTDSWCQDREGRCTSKLFEVTTLTPMRRDLHASDVIGTDWVTLYPAHDKAQRVHA